MMTHWLRNFISLLFIVSIIKVIYMRLRVDWGVICLYLAIQISMSIWEKRGSKGKKKTGISFSARKLPTLLFSRHLRLLEDFENFAHFDHIFYLSFSHLSTPQSGYDPVAPKIWIANTSIWPLKHSWAENIGVGRSFGLHKLGLKNEKIPIFRFSTYNES